MQTGSGIDLIFTFTIILIVIVLMVFVIFIIANKKLKEQKQNAINNLIMGEQNERGRIARDLHDTMAVAIFEIIHLIDDIDLEKPEKIKTKREEAKEKLRIASQTIRDIAHDIMPKTLNDHGLVYTLQKLADNPPQGITIHFADNTNSHQFEPLINNHLYSITLELIQNTIKHSGGHQATLDLFYNKPLNQLHYTYYDDGHGFNKQPSKDGLGLQNIITRAAIINGVTTIQGDKNFYLNIIIKLKSH